MDRSSSTPQDIGTHPVVMCHTLDEATITSARWVLDTLRADGFSIEDVATHVAEHLADTIATYGVGAEFEQAWLDANPDLANDPTPMHQWQVTEGVSATEQHERVMRVVRDLESGAA